MQSSERRYCYASLIFGKVDHLVTKINHDHSGTNKTSPIMSNFSMICMVSFMQSFVHTVKPNSVKRTLHVQ